jgi:hypothetical protein
LVQRNSEIQEQFQFQTDYVLPTGEGSQFGRIQGNFNNLNKDYTIFSSDGNNPDFLTH